MPDRSVVYRLRADVTQFKAQMASAAASVKDAGDKMTASNKSGVQFRKGLDTVGVAAGKIGLVAAVGLGAAVVKAANFDQAMSRVAAATHESAGNMELLRSAALKAGAQTVFSATESADAITAMSKAGVSAQDILGGGLTGALALASAGELDVANAADIAATTMNQFGLAGRDVGHIADVLAAGAGKAQGEVTDFSEALKYVGPVAHQMGISLEETTGTIAELATQGILGEQAGTGLRGMLLSLSAPSAIAAKEMARLGINVYDAQGQFVGFNGVAEQMHATMSNLTAAERDQAFGRIFGNAQVTTARILYEGGAAAVDKWTNSVNDSGFAAETAKTKLDNLKGDLEQLGGALETALIGTGSSSQGPLRGLVQGLTDVVNAYNDLPGAAKQGVGGLLATTALIGGGIFVFSKTVRAIASTREAMDQLGISSTKTAGAMGKFGKAAGIAGVALAGLAVMDAIQRSSDKAAPGIEAMTSSLLKLRSTSDIPKDLDGLADSIDRLANPNAAQKLQDNLSDALGGIGGGSQLREARAQIEALDGALSNLVTSAGPEAAKDALADLADSAGLSKSELSDLKSILPGYKEALAGAANDTQLNADAQGDLASKAKQSAAAMRQNAQAAAASAAKQAAMRKAARDTARSFVGLGDGLDDAKVSLNQWIRQMAQSAADLEHFTANAQKAANRGLRSGLIKALQEAGPEGARRMRQLANGTDEQIARANRAWARGQKAIREYVNMAVPPKKIRVDTGNALSELGRVRTYINSLHDKTVTIRVNRAAGTFRAGQGGPTGQADGGTVMGQRHPYGDKVLTMLAPGEEVISNRYGQADRFRRDRAAGRIPAYADGGTVQRLASGGTVAARDRDEAKAHDTLKQKIKKLNAAIDKSKKAIDDERTARDDLVSQRGQLATDVGGKFLTDLFANQPDNLSFMNPAQRQAALTGQVFSTLKSDLANANAFSSTLTTLKDKGLGGQAFAQLAASGDLARAQAFANLSKPELKQFQTLFDQRAAAASAVGAQAGATVFGAQIAAMNKNISAELAELRGLRADLKTAGKKQRPIHVHDKSGSPHKTAKEVSRRQAMA